MSVFDSVFDLSYKGECGGMLHTVCICLCLCAAVLAYIVGVAILKPFARPLISPKALYAK